MLNRGVMLYLIFWEHYNHMEEYKGVKFKVKFAERKTLKYREIKELGFWAHEFWKMKLAPGNCGNLSVRSENGFIITSAGSKFNLISEKDFIEVLHADWDLRELRVKGIAKPSSESFLHAMIYEERKDAKAIFHVHDLTVLAKANEFGIKVTEKFQEYGSFELVEGVRKILGKEKYLGIIDHGVIAIDKNLKSAGTQITKMHNKALTSAK